MREIRALPEYKPSQPTSTGYRLRAKGFSFRRIWGNQRWYTLSAQSSYGRFGYMNVKLSRWAYQLPSTLFLILASSTFGFLIYRWRNIPALDRFILLVAPACVLVIILGSMVHSWMFDFQPQGRYLSAALIPLALIFGGTAAFELSLAAYDTLVCLVYLIHIMSVCALVRRVAGYTLNGFRRAIKVDLPSLPAGML
jgi:hypothetical protein